MFASGSLKPWTAPVWLSRLMNEWWHFWSERWSWKESLLSSVMWVEQRWSSPLHRYTQLRHASFFRCACILGCGWKLLMLAHLIENDERYGKSLYVLTTNSKLWVGFPNRPLFGSPCQHGWAKRHTARDSVQYKTTEINVKNFSFLTIAGAVPIVRNRNKKAHQ